MADVYAETAALVKLLEVESPESAVEISDAVEAGSTGTEILMALRWHLKRLLESGRCSAACEERAKVIYAQVAKLLET